MKSNNLYIILLYCFNNLIKVFRTYSKFTLVSSCYNMIILPCSTIIWVYSDKNLFSSKLFSIKFQRVKGSNIQADLFLQCIINLLLTDKILSIQNLMRFISTIESSIYFSCGYNIHIAYASTFILNHFQYLWIAVCFHGITNMESLSSFLQLMHICQDLLFFINIKRRTILLNQFFSYLESNERFFNLHAFAIISSINLNHTIS